MKKSTNNAKMLGVILVICAVAYNTVLFLTCGVTGHTVAFWISYTFMLIAFAAMFLIGAVLGTSGFSMRDWLFGYPLIKHTTVYIIAELAVSVLFMLLEKSASWQASFICQFLLVCVYAVFAISCFVAKKTIDSVEEKVRDKSSYIKLLRADAAMLEQKTSDPELKALCHKLAEDVRYSDPMSCEALFELEKEITLTVAQCSEALGTDDTESALALVKRASLLLSERNKKCIALK